MQFFLEVFADLCLLLVSCSRKNVFWFVFNKVIFLCAVFCRFFTDNSPFLLPLSMRKWGCWFLKKYAAKVDFCFFKLNHCVKNGLKCRYSSHQTRYTFFQNIEYLQFFSRFFFQLYFKNVAYIDVFQHVCFIFFFWLSLKQKWFCYLLWFIFFQHLSSFLTASSKNATKTDVVQNSCTSTVVRKSYQIIDRYVISGLQKHFRIQGLFNYWKFGIDRMSIISPTQP